MLQLGGASAFERVHIAVGSKADGVPETERGLLHIHVIDIQRACCFNEPSTTRYCSSLHGVLSYYLLRLAYLPAQFMLGLWLSRDFGVELWRSLVCPRLISKQVEFSLVILLCVPCP